MKTSTRTTGAWRRARASRSILAAAALPWLLASLTLLVPGPSAIAHPVNTFMTAKWSQTATGVRIGHTVSPLSSSTAHTSMRTGAFPAWNSITATHTFTTQVGDPNVLYAGGCSTGGTSGAGKVYITAHGSLPGAIASNTRCASGGIITRSAMRFDPFETWYVGSSTSVPSGSLDLRSTATHEYGHALGFSGHFTDVCSPTVQTMCQGAITGSSVKRTLESHDVHTVQPKYV